MGNYGFRPRDTAACNFVDDFVEQAHQVRKELEPQWRENWANYRVESGGLDAPSKQYPLATGAMSRFDVSPVNFLKTPESHQGANTLRALLLAGLYGTRDYVQADPVGDEDVEAAKKVSRLVMFGCERPGNFRTNYETLGDSIICGMGSYSARWRKDVRLVPRRFPVPNPMSPDGLLHDPETGAVMSLLRNVEVPTFDDPAIETDDLFDTWFDPSANRFDEVKGKCKRFRIRDEELESLMADPNWDAEGIAQVLTEKPGGSRTHGPDSDVDHPKLITEDLTLEDVKDIEDYGYYGGWMFEGVIPKEVADDINEGAQMPISHKGMVILRLINGVIVQAIQSSQRSGLISGGTITILPSGRGLYGISPLTIVRYLQDVSDTQLILTVQAMIESVYQNYLIGAGEGPDLPRLLETRRPREAFQLQGDIDQVVPLPRDYQGVAIAAQALSMLSQTMRNAMNARDPVQGVMQQKGEAPTATQTQAVTAAALQNTDQLAVLIERDELPRLGTLINDLYYVNLDDEGKVFRRTGEMEMTSVNYFDIDAVTDITFVGARSVLNKQAKASQFRDFAQLMLSNPLTAASMDWDGFVRRYGDEVLDVKGLEQLMIKDPDEIVARMMAMGLGNVAGQQVRGGGAGPGGGSPSEKGRATPGNGGGKGGVTQSQNAGEAS